LNLKTQPDEDEEMTMQVDCCWITFFDGCWGLLLLQTVMLKEVRGSMKSIHIENFRTVTDFYAGLSDKLHRHTAYLACCRVRLRSKETWFLM